MASEVFGAGFGLDVWVDGWRGISIIVALMYGVIFIKWLIKRKWGKIKARNGGVAGVASGVFSTLVMSGIYVLFRFNVWFYLGWDI